MKKESLKIIAIITIIIVVISLLISAVILMSGEHEDNNEEKRTKGTYSYSLGREYDVSIDSKGNYTVYLPIPVNETGISYIMDNLTLESGNCTYKIENTTYGLALNITGSGYVMFRAEAYYDVFVENWKVVNTSGVYPETHPITLSMSNITYIHDASRPNDYTNATGYNTTKIPFKIPQYWKNTENKGYLMGPDWVNVHSFIYVKADKPVNVDFMLSGIYNTWSFSGAFTENGWHYVKLNVEEGPVE